MDYLLILAIGLCIGSFLNVCIYRIPEGRSLVFPPSTCPFCGRRLGPLELVPVFSFLCLKGRCKGCQAPIAWQYPLVEALTALLFLFIYLRHGLSMLFIQSVILATLLIVVSFIDLHHQIIPNVIVLPGIIIGLALRYSNWIDALLGALVGFATIAVIIILSRGGMGWGDAKLLAMIGAFLGWKAVFYSLFMGSLFGGVIGVTLIVTKRIERKTPIPFGPYLGIGAVMWVFWPWWFL